MTTGPIGVRDARAEDVDAVCDLLLALAPSVGRLRGGRELLERSTGCVRAVLRGAGGAEVLVGEHGGTLVAVAVVHWYGTAEGVTGTVELWCRFDLPGSTAVGAVLLAHAQALSVCRGAVALEVSALPGDRATKSLLEAEGYRASLLTMRQSGPPLVSRDLD